MKAPELAPAIAPPAAVLTDLNARFENRPEQLLEWAIGQYMPQIALSCSFGGPSGMVLLDMALKVNPGVPVLLLDTGVLFPETYALAEQVERRYGIALERVRPGQTLAEQAAQHGDQLWASQPDRCCGLRKVAPLGDALRGRQAWITGVRRDQGTSRASVRAVEWSMRYGVLKLNPLASWGEREVWGYINRHDLPYNPLLDQGYTSIGCTYCTSRPSTADGRSGRWAGTGKTECGIHL